MKLAFSARDQLPRPETVAVVKWWAGHLHAFMTQQPSESLLKQYQAKTIELFRVTQRNLTRKNIAAFEEVGIRELDAKLSKFGLSKYSIRVNLSPDSLLLSWLSSAQIGLAGVIALPLVGYSIITPGKVLVRAGTPKNPGRETELALK